jgi:multiple sugar transport system substrate-binding protein
MNTDGLSRKGFLTGIGGLGAATLLGGCATSATSGAGAQTGGAVTVESNLSAPAAKAAMQALVDAFNARKASTRSRRRPSARSCRAT